jgi:hypothetical protein
VVNHDVEGFRGEASFVYISLDIVEGKILASRSGLLQELVRVVDPHGRLKELRCVKLTLDPTVPAVEDESSLELSMRLRLEVP